MDHTQATRSGSVRRWLIGAIAVAALVRLPGVAWGVNWPDGFTTHHPDEWTHVRSADTIISPLVDHGEIRYPRATGALVAAPFLAWYAAHGQFGGPRIHIPWTIGLGRLLSVAFGVATVLLVFVIGRDTMGDRVGVLASWLMALGGLHVSYSHMFVADVPAVAMTLLAVWLLWRDLTASEPGDDEALRWAAFAAGAAFALKLFFFAVPALIYAIGVRRPRLRRAVHAAVFGAAGMAIPSLGFDTPATFYYTLAGGINAPHDFDRWNGALLYLVQLPSILSAPFLVVAVVGLVLLARRLVIAPAPLRRHALVVFGTPPALAVLLVLVKLDHFPRHLLVLIPWAALAGGWCLARWIEWFARANRSAALILVPVLLWMAAFVVDAERFFIFEPRNDASRWLTANVPEGSSVYWNWHVPPRGFKNLRWQVEGDPDVLVVEMHEANHYLSGIDWRDTYPADPKLVFDGRTPERLEAMQSLFRGTSSYTEVARFQDAYVMPEYRVTNRLLGDRSRSMISEVVIFKRRAGSD